MLFFYLQILQDWDLTTPVKYEKEKKNLQSKSHRNSNLVSEYHYHLSAKQFICILFNSSSEMNRNVPLWKGGLKFSVWSHMFDVENSGGLFTCSEEIKRQQSYRWCSHEESYLYKLFFKWQHTQTAFLALKMPSRALGLFFKQMFHMECKRQHHSRCPNICMMTIFRLFPPLRFRCCWSVLRNVMGFLALRTTFSSSIIWLKW